MDPSEGTPQVAGWIKRFDRLKSARQVWDTTWQEIAEYIYPRKAAITQRDYTPNNSRDARLYDTTAMGALERAVAGYMSWTTSKSLPWAEFTPVLSQRNNSDVKNWLRECSMLGAEYIAGSNFYAERHEALFDWWGCGTSCIFSQVLEGKTRFEKIRLGTFVFEVDAEGRPYCLIRELELTAYQAEKKFGRENLSRRLVDALETEPDRKFEFLHVVEPRDKKDRATGDGFVAAERKAFLSAYIERESRKIVQMSGFDSFPFHIGRFLKWDAVNAGNDVWGYGPGFALLPEARQLNFLQKMMDVYAEKSVFPPMMVPDNFEGALKTSARATNYYPSGMAPNGIAPIAMAGDWGIAMDRLKMRQDIVKSRCYLDMFEMFSMNAANNREMTAYEAAQLAGEKLDNISPAFDRDTTETIEPLMVRVFEGWAENGMLPPPPESAAVQNGRFIEFPNPTVTMTSRLALAIRRLNLRSADEHVQTIFALAPVAPQLLDTVNLDWWAQERARLSGCDPQLLTKQDVLDQTRQARAQQQQAMAEAQLAKEAAGAVKDAGGIDKVRELVGR